MYIIKLSGRGSKLPKSKRTQGPYLTKPQMKEWVDFFEAAGFTVRVYRQVEDFTNGKKVNYEVSKY